MTPRTTLLLLLAAAGCAAERPVPARALADLPPLPRSSIVAVLAHRNELDLTAEQAARLEQADAELQQAVTRLRAEGGLAPPAAGGPGHRAGHGGAPSSGDSPSGRPGGGFGMSGGPGGLQPSPGAGGAGGGRRGGPEGPHDGGAPAGASRRDPSRAQAALETRLDDADTAAFLKAEAILTAGQRDRAREIAESYREKLFERRELLRGR